MQNNQKKAIEIVQKAKTEVWGIAYDMTEEASASYFGGKISNTQMQVVIDLIDNLHRVCEEFLRQETYLKS